MRPTPAAKKRVKDGAPTFVARFGAPPLRAIVWTVELAITQKLKDFAFVCKVECFSFFAPEADFVGIF